MAKRAIEEAELDGAPEEEAVEVEAVIATLMIAARLDLLIAIPGLLELLHRLGAVSFEALDEGRIDRPAVAAEARRADGECVFEQALLLVHELDQVGDALGVEA